MYCTEDYSESCSIDKCCAWECSDSNDICQNPPTYAPTINPNMNPTDMPSVISYITTSKQPTMSPAGSAPVLPSITPVGSTTYSPTDADSGDSGENIPETTQNYGSRGVKPASQTEGNDISSFLSKHSEFLPFIIIGVIVVCCLITFECCYCYRKRQRKKYRAAKTRYHTIDILRNVCQN